MRNRKLLLTAVMAVLIFTLVFAFAGCKKPVDTSGENLANPIYNVSGYQLAPADVNAITKKGAKIVPIQEMLDAVGKEVKGEITGEDATLIAANIYHMIVRNAANTVGTGYRVATNASVAAGGIKANNLMGIELDSFDVGIRSTYSSMDGPTGSFSQTVSGVTILDLSGPLGPVGDAIKGNFGYNIQSYNNGQINSLRNGGNGGATFFNFDPSLEKEAPKLILGATVGKKVEKAFPTKISAATDKNWGASKKWCIKPVKAKAANTAADTFTNVWDPLTKHDFDSDPIEIQLPGQDKQIYKLGNMGCGWALYDFNKEWLNPDTTTVSYDKKTDVYTLKLTVKDEFVDDACYYAKNTLIKDTKNYVVLDHPKYTKLENTIQVHGCGLIKSWERDELMESDKQAYLTVFTGGWINPNKLDTASQGGSTGNKSISVFSYDAEDYTPERMVALYWPELADSAIMTKGGFGDYVVNIAGFPTYSEYNPKINNK